MDLPLTAEGQPVGGAGFREDQEFVLDMLLVRCLLDIHWSVWSAGQCACVKFSIKVQARNVRLGVIRV